MNQHAPLIALAAGGTGGHMFPAESLAQELKRRGRRVLLVTDARGDRYADSFPADDKLLISAASPNVGGPVAKALAALSIAGGLIAALAHFRREKVDAAVGFGGYPSLPAMKAAALMKIPYGVHEQNGVLGRANRMLTGEAAFVAHAFHDLTRVPKNAGQVLEVGNPVRDAVTAAAGQAYAPPDADGPLNLLVFGGSQGASVFAASVPAAVADLPEALRARLRVVQQARPADQADVEAAYAKAGVTAEIAPFFKDLPQRMADAHLVISRSGASTVTELAALGRPSILTPLPIAMDDHQTGNAQALCKPGGAILAPEIEGFAKNLSNTLAALLSSPTELTAMADAARGRVKPGAAQTLADLVDDLSAQRAPSIAA